MKALLVLDHPGLASVVIPDAAATPKKSAMLKRN
jgi:hypothetical protein